jgi:ribosomal protein S18 acetylase RimI-like enzyme
MTDYNLIERIPTVTEYRELRRLTGLSQKSEEAATAGLPNTRYAVVVEHAGVAIGMGRVIGDGGTAFQITDIAVLPEHQGRGLGKQIVERLVGWLKSSAPKSGYVSLIADGAAKELYAKFGFRETAPEGSVGMYLRIT